MYLWILAAVAAYFIKGLCGFANTLVFTSILSFGVANANISPIDLLLGYPTNLILTWKNRRRLDPKVYLPLAALVLAGSIPGAFLLKHVDARAVKVLFGVVVAALGAEMFSREYSKKRLRSSKIVLAIIGVTAGVLCGLFGVGALLAAYVSRVTEDGGSFKANISAVFIVDNTFRIVLYSALGLLTFDTLKTALLLLPFALAGLFLGMKCSSRMNESLVKKITSILLVLSGILRYAEARYTAQALTPRLTRLSIPGQAVQESYTAEDGSVVIQKAPNQKYLYYFLLRSSSKDIPLKLTEGKAYGFYDGQLYQLNAQFYIHDTSKGVLPLGYESGVEFSNQVVNGWLNPLPAQGQQLELVMVLDEYPDYLDQPDQFLLELTYQPAGFAASLLPDGDTAPRTVRLWSE